MSNWVERIHIVTHGLLTLLVPLTINSCSSDAKFAGSNGTTSSAVATDSPFIPLALNLKAGELGSGIIYRPDINTRAIEVNSQQFPQGNFFDKDTGQFRYQTDVQDIARPGLYQFTGTYFGNEYESKIDINVQAPQVPKNECSYRPDPVIGTLTPQEKWHWDGWRRSEADPRYYLTYSSPVAGDLDSNGSVEVISVPSTNNYTTGNGPIVVLSGESGAVLWNSMVALNQGVSVSTTPVIIDLDNDGFAEIIAVAAKTSGYEVIAFDWKSKTIKWRYDSEFICATYCMAAVADVDADGKPEVVAGNVILNELGQLQNKLFPTPMNAVPSTVTLYDLDPRTPGLEIISNGSQVYKSNGERLWAGPCVGYSGAADIDLDGLSEVVCVGDGKVDVYDRAGTRKWTASIPIKVGTITGGGAPNIGNFSGDGALEIGTAGGDYYIVFDKNGSELWKSATNDLSSQRTGSTIFDFNGDGKVEVIYNDQDKLRIYDGENGNILWEVENASGTLWEYPLVLNVDQDASVEVVVSAPRLGGVRVFEDPSNLWVSSRRLWNQYSYFPEIVDDKLKAIREPAEAKQGFRINTQGAVKSGDKILLPDLTLIAPRFADDRSTNVLASSNTQEATLTFYIANQGQTAATGETKVFLTDSSGNLLGSTSLNSEIMPGAGATLKIEGLETSKISDQDLVAFVGVAEPAVLGSLMTKSRECLTNNNVVSFKLQNLTRSTPAP